MARLLSSVLTVALCAATLGCATKRKPADGLHRSEALYANETYGDPARRREPKNGGEFWKLKEAVRETFAESGGMGR